MGRRKFKSASAASLVVVDNKHLPTKTGNETNRKRGRFLRRLFSCVGGFPATASGDNQPTARRRNRASSADSVSVDGGPVKSCAAGHVSPSLLCSSPRQQETLSATSLTPHDVDGGVSLTATGSVDGCRSSPEPTSQRRGSNYSIDDRVVDYVQCVKRSVRRSRQRKRNDMNVDLSDLLDDGARMAQCYPPSPRHLYPPTSFYASAAEDQPDFDGGGWAPFLTSTYSLGSSVANVADYDDDDVITMSMIADDIISATGNTTVMISYLRTPK